MSKEKKAEKEKEAEKKEKEELDAQAEDLAETSDTAIPEEIEDDDSDDLNLPFPKATIVNMLRKNLDKGKQIKGQVKVEMNLWLGKMVERIAKKMNSHPYTYVDGSMFWDAIETYENVAEIEMEKERLIKEMEAIKAACDVLISEVDRKFVLRKTFVNKYVEEMPEKR
jgi:hypothetical protein